MQRGEVVARLVLVPGDTGLEGLEKEARKGLWADPPWEG